MLHRAQHVVVATISLNGSRALSGVVVNPSGTRVYVAGSDSQQVHVVDAASNTVIGDVALPGRPGAIALTPDGTRLYAALSFNADAELRFAEQNSEIPSVSSQCENSNHRRSHKSNFVATRHTQQDR
jgi:YVTN family beta-propeller protein